MAMDTICICGWVLKDPLKAAQDLNLPNFTRILEILQSPEDYIDGEGWEEGSSVIISELVENLHSCQERESSWSDMRQLYGATIPNTYLEAIGEFQEKTGLTLSIAHYNRDNGSRYDDIDSEIFWEVGGVQDYTVAGKRAAQAGLIMHANWSDFG